MGDGLARFEICTHWSEDNLEAIPAGLWGCQLACEEKACRSTTGAFVESLDILEVRHNSGGTSTPNQSCVVETAQGQPIASGSSRQDKKKYWAHLATGETPRHPDLVEQISKMDFRGPLQKDALTAPCRARQMRLFW
jgi:hypothetical protein